MTAWWALRGAGLQRAKSRTSTQHGLGKLAGMLACEWQLSGVPNRQHIHASNLALVAVSASVEVTRVRV